MDLELQGKIALVTGSTAGIGRAIAELLLREGATVVVNGRSDDSVRSAVDEIASYGTVHPAVADVATAEGAQRLLNQVRDIGSVDILMNNVSKFEVQPFTDIQDDTWLDYFQTNVMSGVRLSRALLPGMIDRGWGRVLFISSESGVNIDENMIHYSVTKTAQLGLARGLAELTRGTGVTVNSVLPGPTMTRGVRQFLEKIAADQGVSPDELEENFVPENRSTSIINRFAQPEEVAHLVALLCSPKSSAINGAPCRVEGGVISSCFG